MSDSLVLGGAAHAQTILVVDDDSEIQQLVRIVLSKAGYEVVGANSGRHALELIERIGLPHLAVVDIHMPEMGGLEFCEIVQRYSDLPIIMLTAEDDSEVVVNVIEYFAEDYIVKPFNLNELVARVVRRVLRRIGESDYAMSPVVRIDQRLAVNFGHQELLIGDEMIPLTPTESKLLYILLRNAGRIVTTDFLLNRLWPREEVFEDTLRVHIYRLRRKIEEQSGAYRYIVTERGQGYRFEKPIQN